MSKQFVIYLYQPLPMKHLKNLLRKCAYLQQRASNVSVDVSMVLAMPMKYYVPQISLPSQASNVKVSQQTIASMSVIFPNLTGKPRCRDAEIKDLRRRTSETTWSFINQRKPEDPVFLQHEFVTDKIFEFVSF